MPSRGAATTWRAAAQRDTTAHAARSRHRMRGQGGSKIGRPGRCQRAGGGDARAAGLLLRWFRAGGAMRPRGVVAAARQRRLRLRVRRRGLPGCSPTAMAPPAGATRSRHPAADERDLHPVTLLGEYSLRRFRSDDETARADALDRLCAELDLQIGRHHLRKPTARRSPERSAAASPRRSIGPERSSGRFEWVQGRNRQRRLHAAEHERRAIHARGLARGRADRHRAFVLDVPCVSDPARAFDQMKLAAARLARTVGGEMVDEQTTAIRCVRAVAGDDARLPWSRRLLHSPRCTSSLAARARLLKLFSA